jgi:hypothetical protein
MTLGKEFIKEKKFSRPGRASILTPKEGKVQA